MLYINDDIDSIVLDDFWGEMSEQRCEQMMGLNNERSRKLGVAAYELLCDALSLEYGIVAKPVFGYHEGGKPFIADREDICFSLSHCRNGAACVVDNMPVGVDIESIRTYNPLLAQKILNDNEMLAVESSARPDIEFIRMWTMKESYLKLTGEGIRCNLKTVPPSSAVFETTINVSRGYVCTVCRGKNGLK